MKAIKETITSTPAKCFLTAIFSAVGTYYVTKNYDYLKSLVIKPEPQEVPQIEEP